jgi:lipopolysaccharide transport system permease protein
MQAQPSVARQEGLKITCPRIGPRWSPPAAQGRINSFGDGGALLSSERGPPSKKGSVGMDESRVLITPTPGAGFPDLRELWRYRDLLFTFASRDLKLRYRQTALGPVWLILGPLLSAGIFSFIFGALAGLPAEGRPYFAFVLAGQLGWTVFAAAMTRAQPSLLSNASLVTKTYFPRILLPLASAFSGALDVVAGGIVLAAVMIGYQLPARSSLAFVPVWLILTFACGMGLGLASAALTVKYRDVTGVMTPLVQLLMYASPVLYSPVRIPAWVRPYYYLNPLASLVQGLRAAILGTAPPPPGTVVYAAAATLVIFVGGTIVFSRQERRFADVI